MTASDHPSALYRTIHAQPAVLREVLGRCAPLAREAAGHVRGARRTFLVGTGTSFHAAIVGQYLLRAAGVDAWAFSHQEFALFPPSLVANDLLITVSHRGNKRYGIESIDLAARRGMTVIGLTGRDSPMSGPTIVLPTAPQEVSSTHTASYTASLTALAMIATQCAVPGASEGTIELAAALPRIPDAIDEILSHESAVVPAAQHLARVGRVVYAGLGPNFASAREGALKVKESSYLVSEGFDLETLLHGGLQALHPGDLGVAILGGRPGLDRFGDLVRALHLLGVEPWLIGARSDLATVALPRDPSTGLEPFEVPAVPDVLTPLVNVIPLQLLACFTAELRGTNPDSFREDDPTFARISASYRL